MKIKLLFILLLLNFLEQPAFGGPCTLDLDISIVEIKWDNYNDVEIKSEYELRRLSDQKILLSNFTPTVNGLDYFVLPDKQGSNCRNYNQSTGYKYTNYLVQNYTFENCGGEFQIKTKAIELDGDNSNDIMWDINEKFKCDGKQFNKRDCQDDYYTGGGGGEVWITCTNLYAIDVLFPAFTKYLKESLQNQNYNNLYQKYQELVGQMRQADLKYETELDDCGNTNWVKYDSCKVSFFRPIIGAITTFRNQASQIDNPTEIVKWIGSQFLSRNDWNERAKAKDMIDFMKSVLTKDQLDDGFFTREMIYTILHRSNPDDFPWKEGPFGKKAEQWYQYAKSANDAKLQELFNLKVDQRVKDFCIAETQKSLLCSVLASKNKYDGSLSYLPQSNPSSISISAYVGDDGLYESFKKNLDTLLQTSTITDSVTKLGGQISEYFQTMARFDNAIAKADVGYLTSAIEKNAKRLEENAEKLAKIKEELKSDQKTCTALNIFQATLTLVVTIAIGVATGGAGFAVSAASMPATFSAVQQTAVSTIQIAQLGIEQIKAVRDMTMELRTSALNDAEVQRTTGAVQGGLTKIMNKLKQNGEKIDNMKMIQQAVLDKTDFNSIQKEVSKFLESYNNYEPAVDPTDLSEVNTQHEQMFDSFERSFSEASAMCKMFVGDMAAVKVRQARAIWASIYSLLIDIHAKQFEKISALAKVVRSKLDEAAAKKSLEPGVNYNFEIIVGHMLSVRVAAQQVCDTFQFMNNDVPHEECKTIKTNVFLSDATREIIYKVDKQLQNRLQSYPTSSRYAFIPVTNSSNTRSINWDDLITGKITEFQLSESSIAKDNGWIDFPDQIALLKSMEIFIPNNLVPNSNNERAIRFQIKAIQDSVVINGNTNAQRYTIKSRDPFSTSATYRVNVKLCGDEQRENLFANDTSKYCIPKDSGQFGNNLKLPLPVSMYSKFQIQLQDGYDKNSLPLLQAIPPVGDTLKLRARLVFFRNSGGGITKTRMSLPTSRLPITEPCGPGQYRHIIDVKRQDCEPCPNGSVPYAQGSYCITEENAMKIAEMVVNSAKSLFGAVQSKSFASAVDKETDVANPETETVVTKPKKVGTKPNVFERLYNFVKPNRGEKEKVKTEKEPHGKTQSRSRGKDEHQEGKNPHWRP